MQLGGSCKLEMRKRQDSGKKEGWRCGDRASWKSRTRSPAHGAASASERSRARTTTSTPAHCGACSSLTAPDGGVLLETDQLTENEALSCECNQTKRFQLLLGPPPNRAAHQPHPRPHLPSLLHSAHSAGGRNWVRDGLLQPPC